MMTDQPKKKRKVKLPATAVLGDVSVTDIVVDEAWNTRQEPADEGSGDDPSADEALRASIEQSGILQPLGVARRVVGGLPADVPPFYTLVYGFRRMRVAKTLGLERVPCVVVEPERARVANLSENFARKNLEPWELMEALARLKEEQPDITTESMGVAVGKHANYVANLLRLRRKLSPELLEAYKTRGSAMHMRYLLEVCKLPQADQAERYNLLVQGARGGRPAGVRNGEKKQAGHVAEPKHLKRWLKELGDMDAGLREQPVETSERMRAWVAGARFAMECALGKRTFALNVGDADGGVDEESSRN